MTEIRSRRQQQVFVAITSVQTYLEKNPLDGKTTSELAAYAGISRNLLQKVFKEVHNVTIREYKRTQKMALATQLLQQGLAARLIARKMRYTSQSAFTTAFKNHFGITPTDWLRKHDQTGY